MNENTVIVEFNEEEKSFQECLLFILEHLLNGVRIL